MKDIHGGDIWRVSREASKKPAEILDFSASINPLGLPPKAALAIKRSLKLVPPYPDPGSVDLREALSSFHGVRPDEVLPANGSTQLIHLIPEVLRPKAALIVEPAFSEYRASLKRSGCRAGGFLLRESEGFSLDLKRLERRLRRGYGLLYIANPANPTGALIEKEAMLAVASLCASCGTTLVVDEAFMDFAEAESIKREAARLKGVIVLRSLTKFFSMAGLRLGFMISDRRLIKMFAEALPPWSINTLAAAAAEAALKDKRYRMATWRWLDAERPFLLNGLKGIPGLKPFPSGANFFLVKITRPSVTAPLLKAALLEKGMLIRELSAFPGLGQGYFRVAVRSRRENRLLIGSLEGVLTGC